MAVMVVAGWCGERDDVRFRAALDDPSLVRDAIEQETVLEEEAEQGNRDDGSRPAPVPA